MITNTSPLNTDELLISSRLRQMKLSGMADALEVQFDDFACGSVIERFSYFISIFREKNISVTMLLQSELQLKSIYGNDQATAIINNADTCVFIGTRNGWNIWKTDSIQKRQKHLKSTLMLIRCCTGCVQIL